MFDRQDQNDSKKVPSTSVVFNVPNENLHSSISPLDSAQQSLANTPRNERILSQPVTMNPSQSQYTSPGLEVEQGDKVELRRAHQTASVAAPGSEIYAAGDSINLSKIDHAEEEPYNEYYGGDELLPNVRDHLHSEPRLDRDSPASQQMSHEVLLDQTKDTFSYGKEDSAESQAQLSCNLM